MAEELVDYEEETGKDEQANGGEAPKQGAYVGVNASGFADLLLKEELTKAIQDCGFEHPSEVQHECIPQAMVGMDIICQAKSGMGKTAVFVLVTLQQLEVKDGETSVLVLCHTRELAYQIEKEYQRLSKHMADVKIGVVYGGEPIKAQRAKLKKEQPHIVVGTPGRVLGLVNDGALKLDHIKMFVLDECDEMLDGLDMRRDVQRIFVKTPHDKQTMMFSATLGQATRSVCKKFCPEDPFEIYVDDESKLTLHGLQQYYIKLEEREKNRKLNDLLDALEFNQVVIFVSSVSRCQVLAKLLTECNFPAMCIHGGLSQKERLGRFQKFKDFQSRILVTTNIYGRGIDLERVNIVINYDFPDSSSWYLHRVGRAGRFGTKGMAISFVTPSEDDQKILTEVVSRFESGIAELPDEIDINSYMNVAVDGAAAGGDAPAAEAEAAAPAAAE